MAGNRSESLIDVDDSAFLSSLDKAFGEMKIESGAKLYKVGNDVANRAKEFSPVDTGRMRSSINCTPVAEDADGAYVDVGTDVEYAPYLEFGTSKMRSQPFMRPALAEVTGGDFQTRSGPPQ